MKKMPTLDMIRPVNS